MKKRQYKESDKIRKLRLEKQLSGNQNNLATKVVKDKSKYTRKIKHKGK